MKTPKREHCCWRCGGPLDVHLDPSGETEEYSICRDCHRKTISHCGHSWEVYKERARWKRKNRDRQQRRIIAALANLCEQAQGQVLTVANCYYSLRERYEANTSCHGQDVEGS